MGKIWIYLLAPAIILTASYACALPSEPVTPVSEEKTVKLPEPRYDSDVSLEQTLKQRRSTRSYKAGTLTLQEVSQLLWAAQGTTDPSGLRTAPSAGALYPLELYLVAGNVQGLASGIYRYESSQHQIATVINGDFRDKLANAALGQDFVKDGAATFILTAVYERTTSKYGERGIRYVHMEAGHAAQNLCLQATALGLGAVTIGAFYDDQVARLLKLPENEQALYVIPVGRK